MANPKKHDFAGLLRPAELQELLRVVADAGLRVPDKVKVYQANFRGQPDSVLFVADSTEIEGHFFRFWREPSQFGMVFYALKVFPQAGSIRDVEHLDNFRAVKDRFTVWCSMLAEDLAAAKSLEDHIAELFGTPNVTGADPGLSQPPSQVKQDTVIQLLDELERNLRSALEDTDKRLATALAEIQELKSKLPHKPAGWSAGRAAGIGFYFLFSLLLTKEIVDPLYEAARELALNTPLLPGQ
jgi:hypothetical protein